MKEWLKAFLSIAAVITGLIMLRYYIEETNGDLWYERALPAIAGIGLLASGLSYFWTKSRFYNR